MIIASVSYSSGFLELLFLVLHIFLTVSPSEFY